MQKSLCDAMRLIDALGGNKSPSHTRDAFNEQARRRPATEKLLR